MTVESGKASASHAKKARKARLRRLKIRRLRSIRLESEFNPCSESQSTTSTSYVEDISVSGGERKLESLASGLRYGYISVMGRRRTMEDAITVAPRWMAGTDYAFFAVYDGHGGSTVAEKCSKKLHKYLEKHIEMEKKLPLGKEFDWKKVMGECFRSMDNEVLEEGGRSGGVETAEWRKVGSTAVVVLVGKEGLVVANCGDSRAVLSRGGVAVPLSCDHKPDRQDEKGRIEAAGGRILNWNGWRVEGILATSRSLGNYCLRPFVIFEPEVNVQKRIGSDDFLIIATDGLWEVVYNEVACQVVRKCLRRNRSQFSHRGDGTTEAATILAELAIAKGSRDNISIIVVQLK
ncbi:unnamed protein product [Fraxinus pennsylvanica]|uniref:protein-serine/threonine phosphatase n=1 Tax=Fraxinus pennsylvanica TaxID=56036 RepID=A0AAD1ZLP0_9LAMI|nr:unnamed protein product [Fraxinus pennsylvanica]